MEKRAILSIDGGGTRGIIPATVLMKLEGATGKPTRETFSFVAETLTEAADCTLNNAPVDLLLTARRVPDGERGTS